MRTLSSYAEAAQQSGCRLARAYTTTVAGESTLGAEFQCPDELDGDPWAGPRLLEALAEEDCVDPRIQALAQQITQDAPSPLRLLHRYVQRRVKFAFEKEETFLSPALTHASGQGDCDDSERLLRALYLALGHHARFVYFCNAKMVPTHVTVQVQDPDRGYEWTWAEVTVPAYYTEHPIAAAKRLGLKRVDVKGDPVVMSPTWGPKGPTQTVTTLGSLGVSGTLDNGQSLPHWIDASDGTVFADTFNSVIAPMVTDPVGALLLLLHESGLNPSIENSAGFVGIFQLKDSYVPEVTGMSVEDFKSLTAERQLPFAAKFWRSIAKKLPLEPRDLYWTNFLPATVVPGAPDDYAFVRDDNSYMTPDGSWHSLPGVYSQNSGLDHGGKGFITAGDMGLALQDGQAAHPHLYAYLAPMIQSGGGHLPVLASLGPLVMGVAAAGLAYWFI